MQVQIPIPTDEESYERFSIRTHRDLERYVPDPEKRNAIVYQQWRKHRGPTEEERIFDQTFDRDRFVRRNNVCIFAEHEAIDGQGRPRKYDLAELARITRSCNHRIADFSGFAPISDGHTSDDPLEGAPEILGYAGPYRLGMIGRKKPRWAIFADEAHIKESAPRLKGKPRRSVELWTFANDPNRTHFDPIAAIGSETPRLPLPVQFTRQSRDGVLVERYTFRAPSSAKYAQPGGGSNTFVKRFQKDEDPPMLGNEDISQILQALTETPHFKWIEEQMNKGGGGEGEPVEYQEPDEELLEDEDEGDPIADLNDLIGAGPEPDETSDEIQPEDQEPEEFMVGGHGTRYSRKSKPESLVVRYSKLQSAHNKLVQQQGIMASQLQQMHKRNADAERRAALIELDARYPDFLDLESELEQTLYSRKADMSDKAFVGHVAQLERYAQRAEAFTAVRRGDLPRGQVDRGPSDAQSEKYAAALAQEAVKIHTDLVNAGKPSDWESARAAAKERLDRKSA